MARFLIALVAALMAISGAALLLGGGELIAAGGSPYYLLCGAALMSTALGLAMRRAWAFPLYGLLLLATLTWALFEAGLDGWALVPRLVAPAVLGLILLVPAIGRRLQSSSWFIAAPVLAIVLTLGIAAFTHDSVGEALEPAASISVPETLNGEWRVWGHTLAGDRFSPLAQVTTKNVGRRMLAWRFDSNVLPYGFHSFEATPLAADARLFVCLDRSVIVALDQDTGHELWRFDPHADLNGVFAATCRGSPTMSRLRQPRSVRSASSSASPMID